MGGLKVGESGSVMDGKRGMGKRVKEGEIGEQVMGGTKRMG